MLEGPILPTLLGLAAPNVAGAAARAAFLSLDAWFVSFLGSDALAGVALVFPFFILMQTVAAGAMGGGVSSAIARALGAGRQRDADALVLHAVVVAFGMAAAFTLVFLVFGPMLYRTMGASGRVLDAAIVYSLTVFSGSIFVCLMNTLINVVRGTGAMAVSASATVIAEIVHIALTPLLIFGFAGVPSLGVAGAGLGVLASYAGGCIVLLLYLRSRHTAARLVAAPLERRLFGAILLVGSLSSLNSLQIQAVYVVLGALTAAFGATALAGFGAAVRLEITLMPLVFTVSAASVTMIGANIGAGQTARALRTAWTGAAVGAAMAGTVGILAALFPSQWMGLFTQDAAVIAVGADYLAINGPVYALFGAGASLFAASQGLGSVGWPLAAQSSRIVLLILLGWLAIPLLDLGPRGVFYANAFTIAFAGLATMAVFWRGSRRLSQDAGPAGATS
jgi:putative MATE family efflux protein